MNVRRGVWIALGLVAVLCVVGGAVVVANSDRWRSSCGGSASRGSAQEGVARSIREKLPSFGEGTSVAIEVVDLDSCAEVVALDADSGFPTASVVKLLIAIDAVERSSGTAVGDLQRMLSASDDQVASRLWTAGGGPDIVRRTAAKLGLADTAPPESPGQWGNTRMSARDIARVYQYLTAEADADTRKLLLGAMGDAPDAAVDGFPQHFGIPDGLPDHNWAIKQGWGSTDANTVLHTTGLVSGERDLVVVLLSTWPPDTDWTVARASLTAAAHSLDRIA
ncbi:hypothetical protein OOZ19_12495 [Saccharopolyspora sp. NFXS83]|uniref:serine hydrolase n=1 Tax=Saccharopolyspora sp. NFXS83 TaxID=2993560 RepID=UPI00224B931A|nr:serine hydrolase [Saccharopolyspora sp. NFXS83]MCX2731063.1 hypothetical protein [Saccharopolyspora sp. NFXS83]